MQKSLIECQNWPLTRWTFFRVKLVSECDFKISWSLGPWDLGTLGPLSSLLQHLILPLTPSDLLWPPPVTSSYSPPFVWFGMGGVGGLGCWVVTLETEIGDGPLTFILMLKSCGVVVDGWWVVHFDYNVSSGPFLTMNFKFDQDQELSLKILFVYLSVFHFVGFWLWICKKSDKQGF